MTELLQGPQFSRMPSLWDRLDDGERVRKGARALIGVAELQRLAKGQDTGIQGQQSCGIQTHGQN